MTGRPKVLFVGRTRYRQPLPPGLQRKWEALGRELDYRVLASAADGAGSEGRFELLAPSRFRRLDGLLFHLRLPGRVRRAIRAFDPDVVVAEDPPAAAAALVARRGRRPRIVAEVHGNWRLATRLYGSPGRRLVAPAADWVARLALRRADAVRALSPYTAALVEDVRGEPPAAAFPTYSDLAAFTARPLRELPERPSALFVGVLEPYKNVEGLAAAWRRVARELPDARIVLVGKGSRRRAVDRLVAELPGSVEHVAELPPEAIAERMDESWVLVLPSRHEGLGRVVIESFARGRGVVAGGAGGILDLVEDGVEGLLVDPEDVQGLAAVLVRVLSDRALATRLGEAAAARFEDWRSTPEEYAARMRALVDSTLAPRLGRCGPTGLSST
ncbi:MAG: glycosyltransferase family 4 protein [Gaiellaceae bacterium]